MSLCVCVFYKSHNIQLTPQKLTAGRKNLPRRHRRRRVARSPEIASRETIYFFFLFVYFSYHTTHTTKAERRAEN